MRHLRPGPRLGSNAALSTANCATSSDLTSGGRKVRVSRGVLGSPTLKEFAWRRVAEKDSVVFTGAEEEGSPKNTSSNAPGDGFAPLSQGLGRKLFRLLPSLSLVDLDLATVVESPCLASRSERSRRSTRGGGRSRRAFLSFPSGTRGFDDVGKTK